jgi:hypothetical protein
MRALADIAADNLQLWHESGARARVLCLLQQEQLGRAAADAWMEEGKPPVPPTIPEDSPCARAEAVEEQVAFVRGFLSLVPDFSARELRELTPASPAPNAPCVAFLDSEIGRDALRRFECVLPHLRPHPVSSFTAVCEEIANDRADFALLPLEDSREGKFLHLYEEIDRFELRVTHVCTVPYADRGRSVLMALLSRRYTPVPSAPGDWLLACTVFGEDARTLSDLLIAAAATGLQLHHIDTLPSPYGEDGAFYHPVFCTESAQSDALFLAYLALCLPRAHVTARYLHLKEEIYD